MAENNISTTQQFAPFLANQVKRSRSIVSLSSAFDMILRCEGEFSPKSTGGNSITVGSC